MTRRSRGREVALQVLYQVEQNPGMPAEEIRRFIQRRFSKTASSASLRRGWSTASKSIRHKSTR